MSGLLARKVEVRVHSSCSVPKSFRASVATVAMVASSSESFSFSEKDSLHTFYENRIRRIVVLKNTHRTGIDMSLVHNHGGIPSMYQAAGFPEVVWHF